MSKHIIEFNSNSTLSHLDKIVETYNVTPHRGLLYETPLDMFLMSDEKCIQEFILRINRVHRKNNSSFSEVLPIGTVVRLSSSRSLFPRAVYLKNTCETFTISKVLGSIPPSYVIKDTSGNEIKGVFYRSELTPIVQKDLYPIKVLKQRKIGKKVEYLVKWIDYPYAENTWISKSQMENI